MPPADIPADAGIITGPDELSAVCRSGVLTADAGSVWGFDVCRTSADAGVLEGDATADRLFSLSVCGEAAASSASSAHANVASGLANVSGVMPDTASVASVPAAAVGSYVSDSDACLSQSGVGASCAVSGMTWSEGGGKLSASDEGTPETAGVSCNQAGTFC